MIFIVKPGTTARTFGPSQLWPRVANVEGEAEVVVAAAKLLAAQIQAQQQQRIHSVPFRQNVFEQQNYRRHNLDNFMWLF